jgi:hypothetical protein
MLTSSRDSMTEMERSKTPCTSAAASTAGTTTQAWEEMTQSCIVWDSSSQYKRLAETQNSQVKITDLEEINTFLAGKGHGSEGHEESHLGWSYENERLKGSCESSPAECATHKEWFVGSELWSFDKPAKAGHVSWACPKRIHADSGASVMNDL